MKKILSILSIAYLSMFTLAAKPSISITGTVNAVQLNYASTTMQLKDPADDIKGKSTLHEFSLFPEQGIGIHSDIYFNDARTLGMGLSTHWNSSSSTKSTSPSDEEKIAHSVFGFETVFNHRFVSKNSYNMNSFIGLAIINEKDNINNLTVKTKVLGIPCGMNIHMNINQDFLFSTGITIGVPVSASCKIFENEEKTDIDYSVAGISLNIPVGITYQIM